MSGSDTVTHLAIEGELTIYTAASTRARLLESLGAGTEVEVDLSNVSDIDSAGVQVMVAAKREAVARNTALRFVGHSPAVLDVLDLCDISGLFGDPLLIRSRS